MKLVLKMAFRNMLRNYRRTAITVLSIALGLAIILWLQCLLSGSNRTAIEKVTSSQVGKIQLIHPAYLEERNPKYFLPAEPGDLAAFLAREFPGEDVHFSPRVHLPSLVSSGENSLSIVFTGIDPERERQVTILPTYRYQGEYLEADPSKDCEKRQIIVGKTLADLLKVELGGKIVLLTQAADGTLGNDLFRVRGIYDSGSREYDRGFAYTTLNCAQKLGAVAGIHEIALNFKDEESEAKIYSALQAHYADPAAHGGVAYRVSSWREMLPRVSTLMKYNSASIVIVSVMLFMLINLGIINTFLISIFERTREFGVMMALGTPARSVLGVVLAECFVMSVVATVLGVAIAVPLILYHMRNGFDITPLTGTEFSISAFKMDRLIHPVFRFAPFFRSLGFTIIAVCAAGVFPAYRASRLQPIDAIRSGS